MVTRGSSATPARSSFSSQSAIGATKSAADHVADDGAVHTEVGAQGVNFGEVGRPAAPSSRTVRSVASDKMRPARRAGARRTFDEAAISH